MKKIIDLFKDTNNKINYEFIACFASAIIVWTLFIINRF